jgi:hypothetical protein
MIGPLDVQISCLVVYGDDVLNPSIRAAHRLDYAIVQAPVIEVAIDLGARGKLVDVELVVDREGRVTLGKLLAVLGERPRDGTRRSRQHLLLAGAQRNLCFADELATRPREHQGQQADEEQLAPEVH